MESYTIGQAARLLGVSVDTARRWADAERFPTRREGTRRMVDGPDLAAFCVQAAQEGAEGEDEAPYTSARNAFPGIVTAVKLGTVDAQVEIQAGAAPHRVAADAGGGRGTRSGRGRAGHGAGEVDQRLRRPPLTRGAPGAT
ncbi:hypothetical protein GCM10020254_69450 [Streptomyces goshikiensis]